MKMDIIKDITNDVERAFYGTTNTIFSGVKIDGPSDGESAYKCCNNIVIKNGFLNLRYPFWHCSQLIINNTNMTEGVRAALWYSHSVYLHNSSINGVKAFRECKDVLVDNCQIVSEELLWRTSRINIIDSYLESKYLLFECKNIRIDNIKMKGKYSFQYTKNMVIENSTLDTKDAFWHAENVRVVNSVIKGEYLAWYAKNIVFENCVIEGTQPFCYTKNLRLINCKMVNCDFAFEKTSVNGDVKGVIESIKNPLKGYLKVEKVNKIIRDEGKAKFLLIKQENSNEKISTKI